MILFLLAVAMSFFHHQREEVGPEEVPTAVTTTATPTSTRNNGGPFFCGWVQWQFAQEVRPVQLQPRELFSVYEEEATLGSTSSATFWMSDHHLFRDCKFCLCMENTNRPHYITEKILLGFLAGCIPIYCGTRKIYAIINPQAFIY